MHSKLSGYVATVHVDLGDKVEKGQVLLTLDVPELLVEKTQKQALVEQAQAEVQQARSAVEAATAGIATATAKVAQAQAGISRATADVTRWQAEAARIGELAASGAINKQLVDETAQKLAAAEAAQHEADAAVDSAKAAVAQAQADVDKAKSDVDAASAKERVALANSQQTETMLAYREIKAPFAGIITQREVDPGYFVLPAGAHAAPLLVIARTDTIRVFAAIPEIEAGLVDVGDTAIVQVQSLKNAEIPGVVSRTAFAISDGSRSLETVIDLANPDGRLRPGMYATAKILLAERPDALVLPAAAVVRKDGGAFCFLVAERKVKQTPIQLGIKVGDDWEIASELPEDAIIALNKAATLKDGQPVDPAPPETKK